MRKGLNLSVALVLCALASPSFAQTASTACAPLKQLAAIKLERLNGDGPWLVPVGINGSPRKMVLGAAFQQSYVNKTAVDELALPVASRVPKMGPNIYPSARPMARVNSLAIGSGQFTDSDLDAHMSSAETRYAGLVGLDVLAKFDIDLDLASGMLNLFDSNHCSGQVVYWKQDAVAVVPFTYDHFGRVLFRIKLDGKDQKALLDTSFPDSQLYLPNSKQKLVPGEAELMPVPDSKTADMLFRHRFQSLEFGGVKIDSPLVVVWDNDKYRGRSLGNAGPMITTSISGRVQDEFTLGLNTLSKLHVYVAAKEKKLYISAATPAP